MNETSKAKYRRASNWAFCNRYFVGNGLDVGCGNDPFRAKDYPLASSVIGVDKKDGSSGLLSFPDNQFDFVYSSNCLEHIRDIQDAMSEWLRVCKPNGHIIFTVPDFELYEQGVWPSRYNKGHLHWFTVESIFQFVSGFPVHIKKIEIVDTLYDYELTGVDQTYPKDGAEAFIECIIQKRVK